MPLRLKWWLPLSVGAAGVLVLLSLPSDSQSPSIGYGTNPELAFPQQTLIPTVNIAPAKPWTAGEMPSASAAFRVNAFAQGLDHPRWLHVLPNGDVLVAESNGPEEPARGHQGLDHEALHEDGRGGGAQRQPDHAAA